MDASAKIGTGTASQPPHCSPASSKVASFFDSLEGFLGRRKKYVPLTPIEIMPGIMSTDGVATVFQLDTRKPRTAKQAAKRAASASAANSTSIGHKAVRGGPSAKASSRDTFAPPPLPYPLTPKDFKGSSSRPEQPSRALLSKQGRDPQSPTDKLIVRHANPFTGLLSRNQTELNIPKYLVSPKKDKYKSKGIKDTEKVWSRNPPYPLSKTPPASTPNLTLVEFMNEMDELVPMPSVHEPAPFTFPGATAEEIEAYEKAIRATTENIARNMNVKLPSQKSVPKLATAHRVATKSPYPASEDQDYSFLWMGGLDQEVHQGDLGPEHHGHSEPLLDRQQQYHWPQTTTAVGKTKHCAHSKDTKPFQLQQKSQYSLHHIPQTPLTRSALEKHQKQLAKLEHQRGQEKPYNTSTYTSIPHPPKSQSTEDNPILIPLGMILREEWLSRKQDGRSSPKMKQEGEPRQEEGVTRRVNDGQKAQDVAVNAIGNKNADKKDKMAGLGIALISDADRRRKLAESRREMAGLPPLRPYEGIIKPAMIPNNKINLGSKKLDLKNGPQSQGRAANSESTNFKPQLGRKDGLDLSIRILEKFGISVSKFKDHHEKKLLKGKLVAPTAYKHTHSTSIQKPTKLSAHRDQKPSLSPSVFPTLDSRKNSKMPILPGSFIPNPPEAFRPRTGNLLAREKSTELSAAPPYYPAVLFTLLFPLWIPYFSKTREILKNPLLVIHVLILAWSVYFVVNLCWFVMDWWGVVVWPLRLVLGIVGWAIGG